MREINFYRTVEGFCPVIEFLDSLQSKQAQKVTWVLQLIEQMDRVPVTYFKKLVGTDLWEVRIQTGNNIFRLLGFMDGDDLIILDHGFQKKTQKTPTADIKLAESRRKDYLQRRPK